MVILKSNFSFEEWKNNSANLFRENVKSCIGIENLRKVLLLSSEVNENGISFYLISLDIILATQIQLQLNMEIITTIEDLDNLGVEYGNKEILELQKNNNIT